jgi:hypothetical protein
VRPYLYASKAFGRRALIRARLAWSLHFIERRNAI